jgi:hypothetical protein
VRYEVRTQLPAHEIIERAIVHFGPRGVGLQLTAQRHLTLVFQGGGGHVAMTIHPGTDEIAVDLETREWDYPVRQFMGKIQKRRHWWQRWRRKSPPAAPPPSDFHILDNN